MKMNAIKFAELVSWITKITGVAFEFNDICIIQNIIDEGVTSEALPTNVSRNEVALALMNVQEHMLANRKIDAIKCLRQVANMSLKEAKDWVERWPVYQRLTQG